MLIQNINPLSLTLALIENSRILGSRHSLLDQAVLLVVNSNPDCSQLDIEEKIYGTREVDNGAIYAPLKRLKESDLVEVTQIPGAATKNGEGRTSVNLTKKGSAFLKKSQYR